MKHILKSWTEGIDIAAYSAYVESIRHRLPPHIHAFASDSRHFDLSSHSSLHDAWLENLSVRENATGDRSQIRDMEVSLSLLGPFHDRRIHLLYSGVTSYAFNSPGQRKTHHVNHGDLLTHEIRLGEGQNFVHEILFANKATFLIEFRDMKHTEEMIPGKGYGPSKP